MLRAMAANARFALHGSGGERGGGGAGQTINCPVRSPKLYVCAFGNRSRLETFTSFFPSWLLPDGAPTVPSKHISGTVHFNSTQVNPNLLPPDVKPARGNCKRLKREKTYFNVFTGSDPQLALKVSH